MTADQDATAPPRTPAKPGKDAWQQWAEGLVVEYGPVQTGTITAGFTTKTFPVYLDGEHIGAIKVARERTYRNARASLGNLRQPNGYANRWRAHPRRGAMSRPGIDVSYTSRSEATAALIKFVRGQQ